MEKDNGFRVDPGMTGSAWGDAARKRNTSGIAVSHPRGGME